jgi:tetratricopeptide (TPR) repeat protein/transglutaminase-like putative cysteine protease
MKLTATVLCLVVFPSVLFSQVTVQLPTQSNFPKESSVFEMLHTHVRFEANGTGSREMTGRIRVQSEAATHELGLLRFSYASTFESLSIDYVRVRKPDGTVVVTPASDVQEVDSEVSRQAPMYTDQREKHVAVKALGSGDVLEYHVMWTVHDAVAPGHFWVVDNFVRNAICLDEQIEVDVPKDVPVKFSSGTIAAVIKDEGSRRQYTLHSTNLNREEDDSEGAWEKGIGNAATPAIQVSSFQSWEEVGKWFGGLVAPQIQVTPLIQAKAEELTRGKVSEGEKIQALYEFVSQHFRYIGVSLGLGRYTPHRAEDVLANRYGDCKDKHTLFAALLAAVGIKAYPGLMSSSMKIDSDFPSPSLFDHVITAIPQGESFLFLDTTPELAGYGYLVSPLRDKSALVIPSGAAARLVKTPKSLPGVNAEEFHMDASLDWNGTLEGKSRVDSHGDSELILRSAFRATAESQWKELVQRISGGLGFGGTVSDVLVAQPEAVGQPFWFSYSYHRPEYSNWKQHQISLPVPPLALPAIAEKRKTLAEPVALGSPLELTYEAKVKLPKGMRPVLPQNVNVEEDFASYTATYSFQDGVLSGVRRLKIRVSEIPGSKRAAYSTFLDAMLEDQGHYMPVTGAGEDGGVMGRMPGVNGHSDNAEAQKLYDQGYESMQLGAPHAATTALERALRLDLKWVDCWLLLGNAHMMGSQIDQGIQAYQKAVALEPTNVTSRRALAVALTVAHRNGEAIAAWQELLKLSPADIVASKSLPALLLGSGRYSEALVYLRNAEEEHGDVPEIQWQLGEGYLNTRDEEKAMEHFHKALQLDSSAAMLNSVAYSLAEAKRDLNDALHYAEEAVKKTEEQSAKADALDSSNFGVMASLAAEWDTLGWVKFRLGDYEGASKYLESAWSVMQAPAIGDHLGQVYEKLAKKQQAAQSYAMVVNLLGQNGDPALRQRMKANLTSLAAQGVKTTKDGGGDLSALRSYRASAIKEWGGGYKTATFGIALTKTRGTPLLWFLSGADELKESGADLSKIKFKISFPDDGPTRVVERGMLSCSEAMKVCTLVLLPVETPVRLPNATTQIF